MERDLGDDAQGACDIVGRPQRPHRPQRRVGHHERAPQRRRSALAVLDVRSGEHEPDPHGAPADADDRRTKRREDVAPIEAD